MRILITNFIFFVCFFPFLLAAQLKLKECEGIVIVAGEGSAFGWTGKIKKKIAQGKGVLVKGKEIEFAGTLENGKAIGFGTYYGNYIMEGNWSDSKPGAFNFYLREVKFASGYEHVFIKNGLRCKLDNSDELKFGKDYRINSSSLYIYSIKDSIYSEARFEVDSILPNIKIKGLAEPIFIDSLCSSHVFYAGSGCAHFGGYCTRNYVVQCENKKFVRLYATFSKRDYKIIDWHKANTEPYRKGYASVFKLIEKLCDCSTK